MSKVIFHGETSFTAWGDSSTTGPWIKLHIHPDDMEQFKLLRTRVGKVSGQLLATVFAIIGDDEVVVDHEDETPDGVQTQSIKTPPPARMKPAPRMGDLGRCAVFWCKRKDFQQWAAGHDGGEATEQGAKFFVLLASGASAKYGAQASRKHLDTDRDCGRAFLDKIFYPFKAYADEHGIDLSPPAKQ